MLPEGEEQTLAAHGGSWEQQNVHTGDPWGLGWGRLACRGRAVSRPQRNPALGKGGGAAAQLDEQLCSSLTPPNPAVSMATKPSPRDPSLVAAPCRTRLPAN